MARKVSETNVEQYWLCPLHLEEVDSRVLLRTGAIAAVVALASLAFAQDSSTGNVSGTVTGPRGASVSGADITLTARITGQPIKTTTSPAGTYAVRDLVPGEYILHVEAKGFQSADLLLRIQPAATATGDVKLQRVVVAGPVLVNTETPEVRGAITSSQMEEVPSDRDFLDLTRLEPGVQLLDGQVSRAIEERPYRGFDRWPQRPNLANHGRRH